jgi:fatty acid desaturase
MDAVRNGGAVSELSHRQLISEIRAKASLLAKKELELTKAEIRVDVQAELAAAKAFGIAALAALFGLNLLLVAGVLALATRIPGWAAALIIGGLWLVIGTVAAYVGWRHMVTNPLALTRQTLKEGVQWVKRYLAQD